MTTKTVTITKDGTMTVVKTDEDGPPAPPAAPPAPGSIVPPMVIREHHGRGFDGASFVTGLIVGILLLLFFQRRINRRRHRPVDLDRRDDAEQTRMAESVAALARRTATLETIVTDPAQRTAREIDALR